MCTQGCTVEAVACPEGLCGAVPSRRFVLGASGHIAGVINPASKNKRSHWINDSATANADEWFDTATEVKGSWWPVWANWLKQHAGGELPARAKLGSKAYPPGEPAPGSYVKQKA